jgi:hypothetical protein
MEWNKHLVELTSASIAYQKSAPKSAAKRKLQAYKSHSDMLDLVALLGTNDI